MLELSKRFMNTKNPLLAAGGRSDIQYDRLSNERTAATAAAAVSRTEEKRSSASSSDEEEETEEGEEEEEEELPRAVNWWLFKDVKVQQDMFAFLAEQSSIKVMVIFSTISTLSLVKNVFDTFYSSYLDILIRVWRLGIMGLSWAYVYDEYQRRKSRRSINSERSAPKYKLVDMFFILLALSGGIQIIRRCVVGQCAADQSETLCNPLADAGNLPPANHVINILMIAITPVIFRAHSAYATYAAYLIFVVTTIIALGVARATGDVEWVPGCMLILGCMIYEYESSTLRFYLAHRRAARFHRESLRAVQAERVMESEKENMCSLIGNIAHDLKTPLQSFMSELDLLEDEINSLFSFSEGPASLRGTIFDRNRVEHREMKKKEIDQSILSLRNIYHFMMLAINRGLDFRKASAGIALQPDRETFQILEQVDWSIKCSRASVLGVPVRNLTNVSNTLHGNLLCPMIISDKHWFCENMLSLLNNALKFTAKGYVDVSYRIGKLVDESYIPGPIRGKQVHEIFQALASHGTPSESRSDSDARTFLILFVEDSGIGILPKDMLQLFQPFLQAQRRTGGTGLGLFSIAKRMEALGGYCGVQDREDGATGSCFWLAYPYVPDWQSWDEHQRVAAESSSSSSQPLDAATNLQSASSSSSSVTVPATALNHVASLEIVTTTTTAAAAVVDKAGRPQTVKFVDTLEAALRRIPSPNILRLPFPIQDPFWRRILLVDDSPMILKTLSRVLVKEGFHVDIAQNGAVGLDALIQQRYVLVLSDIQMPVMDGNEMVRRYRRHEAEQALLGAPTTTSSSSSTPGTTVVAPATTAPCSKQVIVGMSANSDAATEAEAKLNGMSSFIPKPVSIQSIKKCILMEYSVSVREEESL